MNSLLLYFKAAFRALKANLGRSLLTTLGIIIGIVTVIMVFSLGKATQNVITSELEGYGSNLIVVETKIPGFSDTNPGMATAMVEGITVTTLKESDMEEVLKIPNIINGYAGIVGLERVISLYEDQKYMIQASNAAFIDIDQSEVIVGRFYSEAENKSLARVAVIGDTVAKELFPNVDPLNQSIRIKGINFKIIGVMKPLGIVFFQNMDDQVYLPLKTMQKLIMGINHIPYFMVQIEDETQALFLKDEIIQLLDQRHSIKNPDRRDFRVTTMGEAMDLLNIVTGALQILLLVLAAIALLVGGIGVMNVMFVVVTERTREIGLRKAIGAPPRAILLQFLTEAITITVVGGIIGIIAGLLAVYGSISLAQYFGVKIDFFIPYKGIVIAISAALLEGLLFGVYPAKKAASLNPIESLRYE
ncbi:MAG: hypothetical protein UT36_C0005G0019 [Candidatus Peregrinibacteria bacterium GW2011_GWF2_39_17]|nr:MAG: hypothetical protein UT36_C0005G0019 [Candidatus Peregrinibacteria bacterium GW2011_GWF2_39_17]HCW32854.1 hypothetical protein [Candidatus Peregrinibacteria bacterium]